MTQPPWPSPYQPQSPPPGGYGYDPMSALLSPARRASVLSIVLGAMMLVCGVCAGGLSMIPFDQLPPEQQAEFQRFEEQFHAQVGMGMSALLMVLAVMTAVPGVLLIVLGVFVRKGNLGVVVTLIIVTALLALLLILQLVGSLVQARADPQGALGACVMAVPLALVGLLIYYLIGAARAAGQIANLKAQYQAQYWQYQQNQQTYGQPWQQMPPPPPPPDHPQEGPR